MAIAYVGEYQSVKGSSSSWTVTSVTAAVGDFLVLTLHIRNVTTFTITDAGSNTWTLVQNHTSTANRGIAVYTCLVTTALSAGTVTATMSSNNLGQIHISRWTGVLSVEASNWAETTVASTNSAVAAVTATDAGDAVVAMVSNNDTTTPATTPSSPWVVLTGGISTTNAPYGGQAYLIPGATGSYSAQWTMSAAHTATAVSMVLSGAAQSGGGGNSASGQFFEIF
jgi:hypothetical protein